MLINRAYKVRLYPNREQEQKMLKIIDGSRWVYNHFLEQRKNHYLESKKTLPYFLMSRELTKARKTAKEIEGIHAVILQQSLRRLDTAYNRFFRKQSRFPRFKSRFDSKQSFQKTQSWGVKDRKIQIQKDLTIRFRGFLDEGADFGTLVVSHNAGKWFASITAEIDLQKPTKQGKPIGVDVGVETLATVSTGEKYPNLQPQKALQTKLAKAQKELSKKIKGSKRRQKARLKVARIYEKIRNQRLNHLHNTSSQILKKNPSLVAIEDLTVSKMMKTRHMARLLADTSMKELLRQITYKQTWNGGEVIKVDRYFPSSKTCSKCGFVLDKLPLSFRQWDCPQCKTTHDRDINAAKNILKQATN